MIWLLTTAKIYWCRYCNFFNSSSWYPWLTKPSTLLLVELLFTMNCCRWNLFAWCLVIWRKARNPVTSSETINNIITLPADISITLKNILLFQSIMFCDNYNYPMELRSDLCWIKENPARVTEVKLSKAKTPQVQELSLSSFQDIRDRVWQPQWWWLLQEWWREQTCRDSWEDGTWRTWPWLWLLANKESRSRSDTKPFVGEDLRPTGSRAWWRPSPWCWRTASRRSWWYPGTRSRRRSSRCCRQHLTLLQIALTKTHEYVLLYHSVRKFTEEQFTTCYRLSQQSCVVTIVTTISLILLWVGTRLYLLVILNYMLGWSTLLIDN